MLPDPHDFILPGIHTGELEDHDYPAEAVLEYLNDLPEVG